ncbi:MAG: glycosyltransferase family 39 protein [Deltaproteobacteria bacterium]|nr:glycosyltransferase family 39 protein [Deltaproteobacteria bacterium]
MKSQYLVVDKKWELPIILTSLFLGALVVRWLAILQNPVVATDAIFYIKLAKLYSTGDYVAAFKLYPYGFFPLLIASFQKICGDWALAGQWVSVLCGALTVIPLYLLARRIFDEKIALWGAIFYIISPNLVKYSAEVLRDIPFVFFYTTALWWGLRGAKDGNMVSIALASVFVYLSSLFRAEGLPLLIILSLYLIWQGVGGGLSLKRMGAALIILFLFFPAVVSPLGVYYSKKVGRLNLDQLQAVKDHFTISVSNSIIKKIEKEVENENLSLQGRNLFQLARNHRFVIYSSHILYKTVKVFNILFLLFLFGLIKRRQIGYRQDEFLLFAIYVVFVPIFLLYLSASNYLSTRHPFPMVVPSLIWSGVGFVEIKERMILWMKGRDFPLRKQALRWATPLLLLMICVPLLSMAWAPNRKDKLELKEIGLWLKDHGYAHSVIIGQGEFSRLAFYADGEFIHLPKGSYEDTIRFARKKEASILIINKKTVESLSPNFLDMVSPRDLQQIEIPGIKTPKYATTVFLVKGVGEK